jgi:hypothetical protein
MRCAAGGSGLRERCIGGYWTASSACATAETCTAAGVCSAIAELCRGSGGQAVCDGQGALLVCNPDATVASQQLCKGAAHCRAGLASGSCAACIPNEEHHCSGVTLEVCAADGTGFTKVTDCPTAALCNELVGKCTTATCDAGKTACMGDTLTRCNADGTGFTNQTACGSGLCDAAGGDCNVCQPGEKSCDQNNVLTCNAEGQRRDSAACPSGGKCVGAGKCVACTADGDCSSMTSGCKVGSCGTDYSCTSKNAPDQVTKCSTASGAGVCQAGSCVPCIGDGDCANRPGTPICSQNSCVACTNTRGCTSSQTCTDAGCVANCGNGVVDPSEECDAGPGSAWPTTICDASTCKRKIYTACDANCSSPNTCAGAGVNVCARLCQSVTDCYPNPPAHDVACMSSICAVKCGASGSCPNGMHCITMAQDVWVDTPTNTVTGFRVCAL